jgi:hypothetical protein
MEPQSMSAARIPDPPADFVYKSYSLSLHQIATQYRISLDSARVWLLSLSHDERMARDRNMRLRASEARHKRHDYRHDRLTPEERDAKRALEAEKQRERLAEIIAEADAARKAAALVDPYAGLTGFERQLAVAADRGILVREPMGCRPVTQSLVGSTMALFQ